MHSLLPIVEGLHLYLYFVGMIPAGREAGENHLICEVSLKQQLVKCYVIKKMVKLPGDLFYRIRDYSMKLTNKQKKTYVATTPLYFGLC